jgi:hypothetical protein
MLRPFVPHSESGITHGRSRRCMSRATQARSLRGGPVRGAAAAATVAPLGCGFGTSRSAITLHPAGRQPILEAAGPFGCQQAVHVNHRRPQQQRGRSGQVAQGNSTARVASTVATETEPIQWGCYLSRKAILADAVDECISQVAQAMNDDPQGARYAFQPELAIVFISSAYGKEFDSLIPMLTERLPSLKTVFGCSVRGCVPRVRLPCMHACTCCSPCPVGATKEVECRATGLRPQRCCMMHGSMHRNLHAPVHANGAWHPAQTCTATGCPEASGRTAWHCDAAPA